MDSGSAGATGARGRSITDDPSSREPLIGRSLEQALLSTELAAVLEGRGRLVLLSGEAGIGKTTLARKAAAEAQAQGMCAITGAGYERANRPPYSPWLEVFEASARIHGLSPPAQFAGGRLHQVTDQLSLFADAWAFMVELAALRPALILLEDLHWFDPASLDLLRYLAPRLRQAPILLLGTFRDDELTRQHHVVLQLPALIRETSGRWLNVRRLETAALSELIRALYDLPPTENRRLVDHLDRYTEGNPLFVAEVLRTLEEEDIIALRAGAWTVGELAHGSVPSLLQFLIEGRVSRLGDRAREALAIAAVIGHEVSLELWAEVAGIDEESLLPIVEAAVEAWLLQADPDGQRVRFAHAMFREVLYESVLPPRRRQVHRRVGEVASLRARPDVDLVAHHFHVAGDVRAVEWLIMAGDRAQRAYAWLTAADRLGAALSLLASVPGKEQALGRLACRCAYLLRFSDPFRALDALDTAAEVAGRTSDRVLMAEIRWIRGILLCYADRFRSGTTELSAAISEIQTSRGGSPGIPRVVQGWFAEALPAVASSENVLETFATGDMLDMETWSGASTGRFLASAGDYHTAIEECTRSISALSGTDASTTGARAASAFALHGLAIARAALGQPDEAQHAFHQASRLFAEVGHHALVAFSQLDELASVALTYRASVPAVRSRLAAEAEAALQRTGGALLPGVTWRLAGLRCLILAGEWQEADRILHELTDPGNAFLRREITAARAFLCRQRVDREGAWAEIVRLLPEGPATEPGNIIHQEGLFLQRLASELCLDQGDVHGSRAWLSAHDRWLAWSESVLGSAEGRLAWGRHHQTAGDLDQGRAAAATALERATEIDQPLARLAAFRLLGELDTVQGRYGEAVANLDASLALASICDAPFERACTLLSLARLALARQQADCAVVLLEETRAIGQPLGAALLLAQVEALIARVQSGSPIAEFDWCAGLTRRERDVLALLPVGLSNSEIAARLFISPRTVQTHLSNLYAKLGVSGRPEAIAYAVRHGIV